MSPDEASPPAPKPASHYFERTPTITDIISWAMRNDLRLRLRALVGPPGSGKSASVYQLPRTSEHPHNLLVFPVLDFRDICNADLLWNWLQNDCNIGLGLNSSLPDPGNLRSDQIGTAIGSVAYQLCRARGATPVLIPVDALEEGQPEEWRKKAEQFLVEVIKQQTVRVVLTRRDEFSLAKELAWQEEVLQLQPLESPEDQISLRMQAAGQAPVLWPREPWEDRLDGWIARLNQVQRDQCLAILRPVLTPNPYINGLLLSRLNSRVTDLGPGDFQACLEAYVERAGLAPIAPYVTHLLALGGRTDFCETGQYPTPAFSGQPDVTLLSLLEAGVVHNRGREGYFVEPGVAALVCDYHGVAHPPTPTK